MFRNLLIAGALLVALTIGMASTASAHGPYIGHNHGGGFGGYPTFHNTSHYHYQPGTIQQHGNHFHTTPGHYDLHRTGHSHW